jgi:hypothetical protein
MEISRGSFHVFDFDEQASVMTFLWTEKSADMTVDDYKNAIRNYAGFVLKHRARRALIDLRKFHYQVDGKAVGSFWEDEIVPVYNRAGLEKFAFLLPESANVPADETPAAPESGEKFLTRQFASKPAALAWLTAA